MEKEIDIKEYKKILVNLFNYLNDVCVKNNINYSLLGGSLIGCIRENGIIEWDDDIDVIIDRNDIPKLIDIINSDKNSRYKILTHENNNSYYYPYPKLVDLTTTVFENNQKPIDDYGVFIDIFQYNNLPNNNLLSKIYCKKIKIYKQLINGFAQIKGDTFLKRIRNNFCKFLGIDFILNHYYRFSQKYNSKKSDYVIGNWPVYKIDKEKQKSSCVVEYSTHLFEGIDAMIFKNYDELLRTTFGDYMTPPPVEKRVSHHNMIAFYKK